MGKKPSTQNQMNARIKRTRKITIVKKDTEKVGEKVKTTYLLDGSRK